MILNVKSIKLPVKCQLCMIFYVKTQCGWNRVIIGVAEGGSISKSFLYALRYMHAKFGACTPFCTILSKYAITDQAIYTGLRKNASHF